MKEPEELLRLLDRHMELLQQKLDLLDQMGECVRDGRLTVLAELLEKEAALAEQGDGLDRRLLEMRERIAEAAGLRPDEARLGRLVESLDGPVAIALNDRRERLLLAVAQLREKSAATMRLVRHALEFNNRLLAALVGADQEAGTYSSDGAVEHRCDGSTFQHRV